MKRIIILTAAAMAFSFANPQVSNAMKLQNKTAVVQEKDDKYKEIKTSELPDAVTKSINRSYAGYKIDKAFRDKDEDSYKVKVEKGNTKEFLYFDNKGNLSTTDKPTAEKVKDSMDKTGKKVGQSMDKAGKKVGDAANKTGKEVSSTFGDKYKEIKTSELPDAVTKSIATAYTGYKIDKAYKDKDEDSYQVKVAMGDLKYSLFYDEKGELIKVEEPTAEKVDNAMDKTDRDADRAIDRTQKKTNDAWDKSDKKMNETMHNSSMDTTTTGKSKPFTLEPSNKNTSTYPSNTKNR
ncbi:MAG: PepSY-like domain-containing protein [Candidatus Saccharibacteria bacterium]